MKLDINYKKKNCKKHKYMELNNTFLNNQQVTEEIKREIKKFIETNNMMKTWQLKIYGMLQKQF